MEKLRGIVLLLTVAAVTNVGGTVCRAGEKKEEDKSILTEDEQKGRREEGRFDLTDEENNRLLETVRKSDPKKAREIAGLRKKNPRKFSEELKKNAREEYDKIVGERVQRWFEKRRQDKRAAFIDWLKENVPEVSEDLAKLEDMNPGLYARKYDLVNEKYGRVFEESTRHPEEAKVLHEDLKLRDKTDYLVSKIKHAKSENEKKRLASQLEKVLSDRYDLIVIRKQMAYERLLRRLEEMQNYIRKSRDQIEEAKKKENKNENIKERIKTLLEGNKKGIL